MTDRLIRITPALVVAAVVGRGHLVLARFLEGLGAWGVWSDSPQRRVRNRECRRVELPWQLR
jgi:hypothetical protein